jgi:hypothetical protein
MAKVNAKWWPDYPSTLSLSPTLLRNLKLKDRNEPIVNNRSGFCGRRDRGQYRNCRNHQAHVSLSNAGFFTKEQT